MVKLETIRKAIVPLMVAGLSMLLLAWIVLAPAETRLGNLVKLVYIHGALVWTGLLTFSVAGVLGLVALAMRYLVGSAEPALVGSAERARAWYHGTESAGLAALIVWIVYVISAMAVTSLAWGQLVAWNEPRVQATASVLGAAIVVWLVTRLVNHRDFTAAANILMGIVPWILVARADVIRHPVDPIGGSGSVAMQGFYWLIVLTVAGLAATLILWLWVAAERRWAESQ